MEIINGMNPNRVKYFNLYDYISKIKVSSDVLSHMEDTNIEFDAYMNKIKKYNYDELIHFWLIQTAQELVSSSAIERHNIDKKAFLDNELFFNTLYITHNRIHDIHNFVMDGEDNVKSYRKTPVRISYVDKLGNEQIYWHGPEPEDVNNFMDDFLKVYKSSDLSVINSNPFLKSALIELLFVRIHPYTDGNGRTSRVLYSIKFTDFINRIYGMRLKLCPLNISSSILLNQFRYVNLLDNIYFDLEHDNNEYINKWFDFILNMADEQLYFLSLRLDKLEDTYNLYNVEREKENKMLDRLLFDLKNIDINVDEKVKTLRS